MLPKLVVAVAISTLITTAISHEQAVISLNTENFEHATQAASGQTTGYWFVYFGKEDAAEDQQMWRAFAEHQREIEGYVIHAFVDVDNNPRLAERFGIKSTPAFLFFRDKKMYRFRADYTSRIEPVLIEALSTFTSKGWRSLPAENVPPDQQHSFGNFSGSSLAIIIGAVALLAVFAALLGQQFSTYFQAATPTTARHKEQ